MTITFSLILTFCLTIGASVALGVASFFLSPIQAIRLVVVGGVLAYTIALLSVSERRSGRIVTMSAVILAEAILFFSGHFVITGSVAVLWTARALLLSNVALQAIMDIPVVCAALLAGVVTCSITGKFVFAVWSFFLVLSAGAVYWRYVFPTKNRSETKTTTFGTRFEQAHQSAESAIGVLSRRP